jgi:hypothetical protein
LGVWPLRHQRLGAVKTALVPDHARSYHLTRSQVVYTLSDVFRGMVYAASTLGSEAPPGFMGSRRHAGTSEVE